MRKSIIIIVLQIICLLLAVCNHFLCEIFRFFPNAFWFGLKASSVLKDVSLLTLIVLQITIVTILIEDKSTG